MEAADTLESWVDCFDRIGVSELVVMRAIARRLRNGAPIEVESVDKMINELKACEAKYRITPLDELRAAINTQMIAFELERIGK